MGGSARVNFRSWRPRELLTVISGCAPGCVSGRDEAFKSVDRVGSSPDGPNTTRSPGKKEFMESREEGIWSLGLSEGTHLLSQKSVLLVLGLSASL